MIRRPLRVIAMLLAALLLLAPPTLAGPSITLENLLLNGDGTGSIDVLLRGDSGTSDIAGFSVGLQVVHDSRSLFQFTAIDPDGTSKPYLFGTNSLGLFHDPLQATRFVALDAYFDGSGTTDSVSVTAGELFGLFHVSFSGGLAGNTVIGIDDDPLMTNLVDGDGSNIANLTIGGDVTIVPEPSSLLLALGGGGSLALYLGFRQRPAPPRMPAT